MSGDDYISKLFLDNEQKLDEMPSDGLWGRIESKLDASLPGESTETSTLKVEQGGASVRKGLGFMRLVPYMAAASVLVALLCLPFLMNPQTEENSKLAIAENLPTPEEVVLEENSAPFLDSVGQIEAFEEEEKTQGEKIKKLVENAPVANKEIEVVIAESENSIIELTAEPIAEVKRAYFTKPTNTNVMNSEATNQMNETVEFDAYTNAGRAYAVPPAADLSKREAINQIADAYEFKGKNNQKESKKMVEDDYSATIRSRSKDKKSDYILKKDENYLLPQLQIFDWMLGEWIDKDIDGGESHEIWKRINPSTIECNGYKLKRKGKEKIFEEKILIIYDNQLKQVFMKMPIDDSRQSVIFMLTKFDNEYITFEQKERKDFPDEVIFQRSIKGFKVIINNNSNLLEFNQQSYFSNRNRVTNVRAIRVLESAKRK